MKKSIPLFLAVVLWSSTLITCGTTDERKEFRAAYGDPDSSWTQGSDMFWREYYFYESDLVVFEFRRTQGCGSNRDYYRYQSLPSWYFNLPLDQPDTTSNTIKNFENLEIE